MSNAVIMDANHRHSIYKFEEFAKTFSEIKMIKQTASKNE